MMEWWKMTSKIKLVVIGFCVIIIRYKLIKIARPNRNCELLTKTALSVIKLSVIIMSDSSFYF